MSDICGMRRIITDDGIVTYVDPMTHTTKKNRKRHVKDGAPKKERGRIEWALKSNGASSTTL